MNTLFERYKIAVVDIDMLYKMGHQKNKWIPQFEKLILHGSTKDIIGEKKQLLRCALEWDVLTLQRPISTRARKSIATYSLREKTPMGVEINLRGKKMYQFFTRLLFLYLPRMSKMTLRPSPLQKERVWTCVFNDIRSFIEIEYFFQFFENYPGIQCSVFFKKNPHGGSYSFVYLSGFAFPFL